MPFPFKIVTEAAMTSDFVTMLSNSLLEKSSFRALVFLQIGIYAKHSKAFLNSDSNF